MYSIEDIPCELSQARIGRQTSFDALLSDKPPFLYSDGKKEKKYELY